MNNNNFNILDLLVAINALANIKQTVQNDQQSEESKLLLQLEQMETSYYEKLISQNDKLIEQNQQIIELLGGKNDVL